MRERDVRPIRTHGPRRFPAEANGEKNVSRVAAFRARRSAGVPGGGAEPLGTDDAGGAPP